MSGYWSRRRNGTTTGVLEATDSAERWSRRSCCGSDAGLACGHEQLQRQRLVQAKPLSASPFDLLRSASLQANTALGQCSFRSDLCRPVKVLTCLGLTCLGQCRFGPTCRRRVFKFGRVVLRVGRFGWGPCQVGLVQVGPVRVSGGPVGWRPRILEAAKGGGPRRVLGRRVGASHDSPARRGPHLLAPSLTIIIMIFFTFFTLLDLDEPVIGRKCHWMKVSKLDETVFG